MLSISPSSNSAYIFNTIDGHSTVKCLSGPTMIFSCHNVCVLVDNFGQYSFCKLHDDVYRQHYVGNKPIIRTLLVLSLYELQTKRFLSAK